MLGTWMSAARPVPRAAQPVGGWMQREQTVMGTSVSVQLWADDRPRGEAAMAAVMAEMQRIERAYSPHRSDSELSLLNALAGQQPVRVSEELFELVIRALSFSRLSRGAFDISYAAAGRLYDYRAGVAPDDAALQRAVEVIGWQHIEAVPMTRTLRFARPGMAIDLGGFAKGHAVDRSVAILQRHGIRHALVSAGGDSRVLGDRRGRPWTVAIRDPRNGEGIVAVLPLEDVALSTSGDYERFFERDGVRHHHLLDPRTGRSPRHVRSVTIVAEDGLTAEALGKTVFVLGIDEGLAIVERLPGADAVVVDAEGRLRATSGFEHLAGVVA